MGGYGTSVEAKGAVDGELYVPKPRTTSVIALALKTAGIVFLFASLSVLAVSVSRSYVQQQPGSSQMSRSAAVLTEATDPDTGRVTYSLLTDAQTLTLFDDFITTYVRDYSKDPDEYNKRLMVFRSNLDTCDDRNAKEAAAGGTAIHGITRFSDLTSEEFVTTYLMESEDDAEDEEEDEDEEEEDEDEEEEDEDEEDENKDSKKESTPSKKSAAKPKTEDATTETTSVSTEKTGKKNKYKSKSTEKKSKKSNSSVDRRAIRERVRKLTTNEPLVNSSRRLSTAASASSSNPFHAAMRRKLSDPTIKYVDWSGDYTTDVKNGGSCAGSWAIAAAEQIESDGIVDGLITINDDLSAQQLLSCTEDQDGCSGGSMQDALTYAQKPGGIWKTADYGYTSSDGEVDECETLTKPYALTVGGIFELNTDDIATNTERLMVQRLSNTGTLSVCLDATIWSTYVSGTIYNCDNNQINHCAHVVGVYFSSAENSGFYKIRNHWGTDWGIDGYVSVAYGSDVCGVASTPMYTDTTQDRRRSLRQ